MGGDGCDKSVDDLEFMTQTRSHDDGIPELNHKVKILKKGTGFTELRLSWHKHPTYNTTDHASFK